MFSFPFKVHEDGRVDIRGLATGKVKELHGAGKKWRLWHSAGHGFQNGRDWQYGEASHWIVRTDGTIMDSWTDFELSGEWREGRKILVELVDRLNDEPDIDHLPYLRWLEGFVRDYEYKYPDLGPVQKLWKAFEQ